MGEILAALEREPDDEALAKHLAASTLALRGKVDSYVGLYDEYEARAKALRDASRKLQDAARSCEGLLDRLKRCARIAAGSLGRDRLSGTIREIRVVETSKQAVEILSLGALPQRFKVETISVCADKEKLAEALIRDPVTGAIIDKTTGEDLSGVVSLKPVVMVRFK
jgi:hypothetical protein